MTQSPRVPHSGPVPWQVSWAGTSVLDFAADSTQIQGSLDAATHERAALPSTDDVPSRERATDDRIRSRASPAADPKCLTEDRETAVESETNAALILPAAGGEVDGPAVPEPTAFQGQPGGVDLWPWHLPLAHDLAVPPVLPNYWFSGSCGLVGAPATEPQINSCIGSTLAPAPWIQPPALIQPAWNPMLAALTQAFEPVAPKPKKTAHLDPIEVQFPLSKEGKRGSFV